MLDPDRFITNYQSTLAKKNYATAQKPALPNNSFSHSPQHNNNRQLVGQGKTGQNGADQAGQIPFFHGTLPAVNLYRYISGR